MRCLLVIDDQLKDLKNAVEAASSLGIEEVQARASIAAGRAYLERALKGTMRMPDGIVLDLDFGIDSGFELLRYWHGTPELAKIPVLIWSVMDERRELCELFGVKFVSKWEGMEAFQHALGKLAS